MTHGILKANALPEILRERMTSYSRMGFFYEHKTYTPGLVFEESDLERFVKENGQDPAEHEGAIPKNRSDDFPTKLREMEWAAFKVDHKEGVDKAIRDNYLRYEILEKKK
jgi:hypothetical protein